MSIAERFWSKVDKSNGAASCWLWTASIDTPGYGAFKFKGKKLNAHRVALMLSRQIDEIPKGLDVMHSCDVRACCNPNHLSLGTRLDNVRDAMHKRRHIQGEAAGNAKLSAEIVQNIRRHWLDGKTQASMAREYKVSEKAIWDVVHGNSWQSVTA